MTPQEITQIGQALFGSRWKAPLARAICVQRETVSRWVSGKQPIASTCAKAVQLLYQQGQKPFKERRFNAKGTVKHFGDNATLIHGDCRSVISTLDLVDVVLTDPVWTKPLPSLAGSENPTQLFYEMINCVRHILKPTGRLIIQMRCDSDPRILSAIPLAFPFVRIAWLPYAVPSRQGRMLISGDVAYLFGGLPKSRPGNHVMPGQPHGDFCPPVQPSTYESIHPCPRHLTHVEWLIEKFTEPNEIVLDPFMGVGTTAVAALNRGRRFVGVEIEKKYWIEAQERISKNCRLAQSTIG
jgi:hypothetical protein